MSYESKYEDVTLTRQELDDLHKRHVGSWQTVMSSWGGNTVMVCSCDLGSECSVPRLLAVIETLLRQRNP